MDQLNVKVSGASVYKAVHQYLHDNAEIKARIGEMVEKFLHSEKFEGMIEKHTREILQSYAFRPLVDRAVKDTMNADFRAKVEKHAAETVEKVLKNAVFFKAGDLT